MLELVVPVLGQPRVKAQERERVEHVLVQGAVIAVDVVRHLGGRAVQRAEGGRQPNLGEGPGLRLGDIQTVWKALRLVGREVLALKGRVQAPHTGRSHSGPSLKQSKALAP